MPSMADLTVKKADGTTDITYTAISASGGDASPAVWRQDIGAPAAQPWGHRPVLRMSSKSNGPKTARQVAFDFAYPFSYLDANTGNYVTKDKVFYQGMFTGPSTISIATLMEAAHQGNNLLATALLKMCFQSGYAPT